jgi:thiol-disulfide isomerase/thioredoxin
MIDVSPRDMSLHSLRLVAGSALVAFAVRGDATRAVPDFSGAVAWLNSPPLRAQSLRGKVVLVDFWTYSCINSLRELPYIESWAAKYKDAGLVVIGVHTPEFSFEKEQPNVARALRALHVAYPVPMDNDYKIWQAFDNEYWPADYLIDGQGRVRYHHFGEGSYAETERMIQQLLKENGATAVDAGTIAAAGAGIEAPPSDAVQSPETYVGSRRAERLVPPDSLAHLALNAWGLTGSWMVGAEGAVLQSAPGAIVFRFHARDLHLVLTPPMNGTPVRFRVTIDGASPGPGHGLDTAPDGTGEIREPRLYQLIRQTGPVRDRTFKIEFLDPGVEAYAFTFG